MIKIAVFLIFAISLLHPSAEAADKIKVLVALDQNGSLKTTARLLDLGVRLSAESQAKYAVEIREVDIGEDLNTTATRLEKTLADWHPDVIIGAITSNQALVIGAIAERLKITFITPFATSPKVTEDKRFVFRSCFDDSFQTHVLSQFIQAEQGLYSGVVLFNNEQSYSRGVNDIFVNDFKNNARSKVTSIGFANSQAVDEKMVRQLKSHDPNFILIPSYQIESAEVIAKLSATFSSTIFFGTDSWGGGRLFQEIIQASHSKFSGFFIQHWSENSTSVANTKFLKMLRNSKVPPDLRFNGTDMNAPVAAGFDAMGLILAAKNLGPLPESLRNMTYDGATGRLIFSNSQTPKKSLFIYKITESGDRFYKEIKP